MTETTFPRTIDWDRYWSEADDGDALDASPSAQLVVDPLLAFLEARGAPDSHADVGCGPGATTFAVADRYPDADVVGYDAAEPVLAADRERARRRDLDDVSFEHAVLPGFDPGRQFDLVTALFTLCYVADVESALQALYDAVAPGGHLVVTYHNSLAQSYFSGVAEDPHEHLPDDGPFDPDTYADRFELVIEGESLLSHERIHDVLGTWPQSVWSVVGTEDRYGAWRHNPLVFVPK